MSWEITIVRTVQDKFQNVGGKDYVPKDFFHIRLELDGLQIVSAGVDCQKFCTVFHETHI
jgi:hypothetical protein